MCEYHFNGTYIDFFITCLDSTGAPATGQAANITVNIYDSTLTQDTAVVTVSEVGTSGIYRVRTTYTDLNRAAGDGLWIWTFSHATAGYSFDPRFVALQISAEIGTVNTTNFAPTTTQAEFDGLSDTSTDHYKDAFIKVLTGANKGEVRKITGSQLSNGRVLLTFNAMDAPLGAGDVVKIINE